jgi:multimeric flavodoxin WrbA
MDLQPRTGQFPGKLDRERFRQRFREQFYDPAFGAEEAAIERLEAIAWDAYRNSRKAPVSHKAGPGYADPDYDLSDEWREASERLKRAERRQQDPQTPSRVLVVVGASRNDGTCPGEMSKSWRLAQVIRGETERAGVEVDLLDLSLTTSEYGRTIHPCKACVSTAMPLCHWPCSCYPNHSLGQIHDWMNEIYERWVSAHAIVLVTPVYWYQSPSPLKLMIDRLVCADGGNPDPSSTSGKDAEQAKRLEMAGWPYPKHLAGRVYGLVVHGDVAGVEHARQSLSDWLDWMGLIAAGADSRLDRFIGYYKPYATSHRDLDEDAPILAETANVARAVVRALADLRAGRLSNPDAGLRDPRPK